MCSWFACKMKKFIFLNIISVFAVFNAFADSQKDSLNAVLQQTKVDSVKIEALFELSFLCEGDEKRNYLNQALKLSLKSRNAIWTGHIYEEIGNQFYPHNLDSCDFFFKKSLQAYEVSGNKTNIAKALNNVGIVYWYKNELAVAIDYYLRAMELNLETKNTRYYAINCLNIAMLYSSLEDYDNALLYVEKLDTVNMEMMGPAFQHGKNNTQGIILYKLKKLEEARDLHRENFKLAVEIQDSVRAGMSLENLGLVFYDLGRADSAVHFYEQSFSFYPNRQIYEYAGFYNNLGNAHLKMRNFKAASIYFEKALDFGLQSGYNPWIYASYQGLADLNKETRNFEKATFYFEKLIELKDSILKEENQSALNELETKFQSEQNQKEIELLKKNEELNQAEIRNNQIVINQQNEQKFYFVLTSISLAVVVVVILIAYFANRKSKQLLLQQKEQIEFSHIQLMVKNTEIIDSLNYSKRLQNAILPPTQRFEKHFKSSFIYYQPKDIVSGDFYWLEEHNGILYLAVADCTGHGVPGALVSVVCANTLSRVLVEENPSNPAEILNKSREIIKSHFSRHEENISDGMDISLCSISTENKTLNFAGANNPLWILRNEEIIELAPDKQPIGKFALEKPFKNQTINLLSGDRLYLFSDGLQDQFGGEKGKKFKASNLKKLILSTGQESLDKQQMLIQNMLEDWKGKLEQVDDICMVAVQL